MQDEPPRPSSSASPPPAQPAPGRAGNLRSAADATTGSQHENRSAPAAARPNGKRMSIHPLWLALGVAALFGLIFGIGAFASGGTFTASAPSGTDVEATTINVIHTVDPSVVQVQARGASGSGVGSGEILTTSGYIVTNDHVLHALSSFTVLLADGRRIPAQLVGEAPTEDLAVLKISAPNLKPIAVGDSSTVQVGMYALAIGSPLGLEQSATFGIISALSRQANVDLNGQIITLTGMIQTSVPINPGNSGGALVTQRISRSTK